MADRPKLTTPSEKAFRDDKRTADVMAQEDSRRAADSAKTSRLRAQRLAKEAADRSAKSRGKK